MTFIQLNIKAPTQTCTQREGVKEGCIFISVKICSDGQTLHARLSLLQGETTLQLLQGYMPCEAQVTSPIEIGITKFDS